MSDTMQDALAAIRDLGSVEDLTAAARAGLAPAGRPRCNSHVHLPPNFSAFETVGQVIELAKEQNVRVLGVSNYYDYRAYGEFVALTRRASIFPEFGLEVIGQDDNLTQAGEKINDPGNPGRIYICGKGITGFADPSPRARKLLGRIRSNDECRMAEMTARVAEIFAENDIPTGLNDKAIVEKIAARHGCDLQAVTLQERHIAMAFQQGFFETVAAPQRAEKLARLFGKASKNPNDANGVQGEIRRHLMKSGKRAFVKEAFLNCDEAFELIHELGGIVCYPTLADGANPMSEFEESPQKLIGNLKARNLHMVEFIPNRNKPQVLRNFVKTLRASGMVVVAGTEHNTQKLTAMYPTCVDASEPDDELQDIFFEGACVVAAHEFLRLHGQAGFVDTDGRPNSNYATNEQRIDAFARLGAAVIETFLQKYSEQGE